MSYVGGLLRFTGGTSLSALYFAILATAAGTHFVSKRHVEQALERYTRFPVPVQAAGYAALIVLLAGMALGAPAFIYFQF